MLVRISMIAVVFFVFISLRAVASIPQHGKTLTVEQILAKKTSDKFDQLRQMGPGVYGDLRKIAFDEEKVLGLRWQAFMALVRIGEKESLPEVKLALQSRDWFLRDAAIRVLPLINKDQAYKAGMATLNDSALVVRTAAVDTLAKLKNSEAAPQLWVELYNKNNYIKHQSLWIRRHIVEALADLAPAGSEEKFIKVLDDSDSTLFAPAIRGLERLTKQKLGEESVPPVYRRYYWKKWYKDTYLSRR